MSTARLLLPLMLIVVLTGCGGKDTPAGAGGKVVSDGPWTLYKGAFVLDLALDPARNCLWLAEDYGLWKLDLTTGEHALVTDGGTEGRIGAMSVALEGDHVWVGGHKSRGKGGLWMYDIPTGKTTVYREETTRNGEERGLQSNTIPRILAAGDALLLYSDTPAEQFGLTVFRPRETDFAKRWKTLKGRDIRNPAELLYNNTRGACGDGEVYLLMFESAGFQSFDAKTGSLTTLDWIPAATTAVSKPPTVDLVTPSGETTKTFARVSVPDDRLYAVDGPRVWFHTVFEGVTTAELSGVVCYDRSTGKRLLLNNRFTESTPEARDGLPDSPNCLCIDADDVWMATSAMSYDNAPVVFRYNQKTHHFTRQLLKRSGPIMVGDFWRCTATPEAVYFATSEGVLRLKK